MIDGLYSSWTFNNVDFATNLQYSVSIYFLQNIFKVHSTIGFSPQDMRQLLSHAWSTFSWCYCGNSIHFLMPLFFFSFEPFYFAGSKEPFHFAWIRKLFHQGTTWFFFFGNQGTTPFCYNHGWNQGITQLLWNQGTTPFLLDPCLEPRNYSVFTRIKVLLWNQSSPQLC